MSLYNTIQSNDVARVTVEYTIEADGVKNAVVPVLVGAVAVVTATPPAVYPVPETSPVML